jgi:hypothetical protein
MKTNPISAPLVLFIATAVATGCAPESESPDDGGMGDQDDGEDESGGEEDEDEDEPGDPPSEPIDPSSEPGDPTSEPDEPAESSSGADEPAPACEDGDFTCDGDTIDWCENGTFEPYSCDAGCGESGYTSSGCNTAEGCVCDGFADATCETGTAALCTCFEWAGIGTCTTDMFVGIYDDCWAGTDLVPICFSAYVSGTSVDCASAVEVCL